MSKIRPGGLRGGDQFGTTFHNSDTLAPSLSKGANTKASGKTKAGGLNPNEPHDTTFVGNKSHIKFPKPSSLPEFGGSKVMASGTAKQYVPGGSGIYPNPGQSMTDVHYPKHGARSAKDKS